MSDLDPVLAGVAAGAMSGPGAFAGSPEEARARIAEAITKNRDPLNEQRVDRISVECAEDAGHEVPVRISWPKTAEDHPVVVFVHGGGYALLSAELCDDISTRLSEELDAIVVAVDYRLAPENPFPSAIEDVAAAVRWACREAVRLGGSPDRVILMGESAGANIAASVSVLVAGEVALAQQVLVVPSPDMAAGLQVTDVAGSMLRTADMAMIRQYYFGDDMALASAFPASAMASTELHRSPPTVIALAGFDPTAPVGAAFARRLEEAGVPVKVLRFPTMFHPFLGFAHVSPGAAEAFSQICDGVVVQATALEAR